MRGVVKFHAESMKFLSAAKNKGDFNENGEDVSEILD